MICDYLIFILWVGYFNRLILFYYEKESYYEKERALLIAKQDFEKKFSRKKLRYHYFFNTLECLHPDFLMNHGNDQIFDKLKFTMYYSLVDSEKEVVELEKEFVYYRHYIDVENFKHQRDVSVSFNILGQAENHTIIPLLFEPLIGNAMKYTKQDGTGWVEIVFDVTHLPVLKFYCKNNYTHYSSNVISSENGLKILEERLELYYINNYTLKVTRGTDLYEVELSIKMI